MKPIPPTEAALVQALLEILWLMTRQTKSSCRFSLGEGTQKRVEKKALIRFNRGIRSPDGAPSKLLRILEAHPELIDA